MTNFKDITEIIAHLAYINLFNGDNNSIFIKYGISREEAYFAILEKPSSKYDSIINNYDEFIKDVQYYLTSIKRNRSNIATHDISASILIIEKRYEKSRTK